LLTPSICDASLREIFGFIICNVSTLRKVGQTKTGTNHDEVGARVFGRDITDLARRGILEPVIGRKDEILRVARILSQKRKSNPIQSLSVNRASARPGLWRAGAADCIERVSGISARREDPGDFHVRPHRGNEASG
jgi:hypothetical protein